MQTILLCKEEKEKKIPCNIAKGKGNKQKLYKETHAYGCIVKLQQQQSHQKKKNNCSF